MPRAAEAYISDETKMLDLCRANPDDRTIRGVLADWYLDHGSPVVSEAWMLLATVKQPMRLPDRYGVRWDQCYWRSCSDGVLADWPFELKATVFNMLKRHWLHRRGDKAWRHYRCKFMAEAVWAAETDFVQAWCAAKKLIPNPMP